MITCSDPGLKQLPCGPLCFRRSYYAADWASFTFNGLLTWIQQRQVSTMPLSDWLLESLLQSCRKTTGVVNCTAADHDEKYERSAKMY